MRPGSTILGAEGRRKCALLCRVCRGHRSGCGAWGRHCRWVAVDAAHVSWSQVWRMGLQSWSSRAWHGAMVAVDAARVSCSHGLCAQ